MWTGDWVASETDDGRMSQCAARLSKMQEASMFAFSLSRSCGWMQGMW